MPNNYKVRNVDCSEKDVVFVRGVQAAHMRRNRTASHLTTEFVLLKKLEDGDDLHIFTTKDDKDIAIVAKAIQENGGCEYLCGPQFLVRCPSAGVGSR